MRTKTGAILTIFSTTVCLCAGCGYNSDQTDLEWCNPIRDWGFTALASMEGYGVKKEKGKPPEISIEGKMSIDFAFEEAPLGVFQKKGAEIFLDLGVLPEKTDTPAKVVFTTPVAERAWARIPPFEPETIMDDTGDSFLLVEEFSEYPGNYNLRLQLDLSYTMSGEITKWNCFSQGSEHYIYGKVELFGLTLENPHEEPLVFMIERNRYLYLRGKGMLVTSYGKEISLGE